ncbi:hypothetical protein HDU96_010319 [Phlyctochytrium bullatum]|nr:hypothetical protein HDU96_010319 [Phlyctochytrium bullatum]
MGRAKLALRDDDKAERLSRLQKRKVHLDELHPTLHPLVVEDFLTLKYPAKKLLQVIQSHKTALLLQHLLPQNPRPWLMRLFEQFHVTTPREAAAVALRGMETPERIRRVGQVVFSLLWRDIVEFMMGDEHGPYCPLSKSVMAKTATRCNEVFSFTERRHISWELSARDLKADIAFEMEAEDPEEDYTKLLSSEAFEWLWRVVKSFRPVLAAKEGRRALQPSRGRVWKARHRGVARDFGHRRCLWIRQIVLSSGKGGGNGASLEMLSRRLL